MNTERFDPAPPPSRENSESYPYANPSKADTIFLCEKALILSYRPKLKLFCDKRRRNLMLTSF